MWVLLVLQLVFGSTIIKENDYKMGAREDKIKAFLKTISMVESSGGKNLNHPEIKTGIQAGHRAMGRYGLMPNTVGEIINRMRLNGTLSPDMQTLRAMDPETLREVIEANPDVEDQLAGSLAERILERQPDEQMAAYSWNQGHNLSPEQIAERGYQDNDYVQKYNNYRKMLGEEDGE